MSRKTITKQNKKKKEKEETRTNHLDIRFIQ